MAMLELGCTDPNCTIDHSQDVLYVHAKCHPQAPVWVCFLKGKNTAAILCAECNEPIIYLAIGARDVSTFEQRGFAE